MSMSEGQEPVNRPGSLSVLLRNVSEAQDIIANFGKATIRSCKPLKSSLENLFPEVEKLTVMMWNRWLWPIFERATVTLRKFIQCAVWRISKHA